MLHKFACHPCAGTMLIFSVLFQSAAEESTLQLYLTKAFLTVVSLKKKTKKTCRFQTTHLPARPS